VDQVLKRAPVPLAHIWSPPQTPLPEVPNRLYFAENLDALAALARDPAVSGKVRLVYIDPPFASQADYHSRGLEFAYQDNLTGAEYVEFLRHRLLFLREILAQDGSIYVHLDDKMVFHAKLLMDEVFGPQNFQNMIVRRKCNPKNFTHKRFGNVADFILFYSKSALFLWNQQFEEWTEDRTKEYRYTEPDTGRRYMLVPIHAPGTRNGETGQPWRGTLPPPGKHWQYPPRVLDEMDQRGELRWSVRGNPRRKVYLDASKGIAVQDIWWDFPDPRNQNTRITGYPTEKNPDLIRRIIAASSNPGDIVLDCFSGSGTTLEAASSLGRRWIGVDSSREAISATLKRLITGTTPMGDFVSPGSKSVKPVPTQGLLFDQTPQTGPFLDFEVLGNPDHESIFESIVESLAYQAS
jgi:adenine-specific DNA-methyltransferase